MGRYTVHYGALAGYVAPADQAQSVVQSANTAFNGTYLWAGTQFLFH